MEKQYADAVLQYVCTHPHGDADGTVHVAFIQPAVFGYTTFLGAQGGCILQETMTQNQKIKNILMLYTL